MPQWFFPLKNKKFPLKKFKNIFLGAFFYSLGGIMYFLGGKTVGAFFVFF